MLFKLQIIIFLVDNADEKTVLNVLHWFSGLQNVRLHKTFNSINNGNLIKTSLIFQWCTKWFFIQLSRRDLGAIRSWGPFPPTRILPTRVPSSRARRFKIVKICCVAAAAQKSGSDLGLKPSRSPCLFLYLYLYLSSAGLDADWGPRCVFLRITDSMFRMNT